MKNQELLLEQFVAAFDKLDDMRASGEWSPVAWQLAVGDADELGWKQWRPIRVATDRSLLEPLYAKLPGRFPPLYEKLVLSYRWAEVDLMSYRLIANPPGPDLNGLFEEITRDSALRDALLPAGYIQFGKGPDLDYDPVCFDVNASIKGDYRIIKFDHEEILCNDRLKIVAEVASSFEELVSQTIKQATQV